MNQDGGRGGAPDNVTETDTSFESVEHAKVIFKEASNAVIAIGTFMVQEQMKLIGEDELDHVSSPGKEGGSDEEGKADHEEGKGQIRDGTKTGDSTFSSVSSVTRQEVTPEDQTTGKRSATTFAAGGSIVTADHHWGPLDCSIPHPDKRVANSEKEKEKFDSTNKINTDAFAGVPNGPHDATTHPAAHTHLASSAAWNDEESEDTPKKKVRRMLKTLAEIHQLQQAILAEETDHNMSKTTNFHLVP